MTVSDDTSAETTRELRDSHPWSGVGSAGEVAAARCESSADVTGGSVVVSGDAVMEGARGSDAGGGAMPGFGCAAARGLTGCLSELAKPAGSWRWGDCTNRWSAPVTASLVQGAFVELAVPELQALILSERYADDLERWC